MRVGSCLKHFPGHGDTANDTHKGYAESRKTWEEMLQCEMLPFRAGIEEGTDMIMTAHIAAPRVTGSDVPSTMSRAMLTDKLRGELGYEGLIVTDALAMGAITRVFTPAEAALACLRAGADLVLMPFNYYEAFDGVEAAVRNGEMPEARIDESLRRVLAYKKEVKA